MVDYYNGTEFPNEDEMPNKIGVFHIRGPSESASCKNSLQEGSHILPLCRKNKCWSHIAPFSRQ